jgi:hypothetical protein
MDKITTKEVRDKYFELIEILNQTFPGSVVDGKFSGCSSRRAWINFSYCFPRLKKPTVCISFWCMELKEFGNCSIGQHYCQSLIEAVDYINNVKERLLKKQQGLKAIGDLFYE